MHSSGSITRKFGPSWKQSTGQTSTQSVYLHLMQASVTTKAMRILGHSGSATRSVESPVVQASAARRAIFEIASQRELDARKRDIGPRHFALLDEPRLEALDADPECVARQHGAEHHVHLLGMQHVHDGTQAADLDPGQGLFVALAGGGLLQGLADFHEAGGDGPEAAPRLDGAAANQDAAFVLGDAPGDQLGIAIVGRSAAGADGAGQVVAIWHALLDRRGANRAELHRRHCRCRGTACQARAAPAPVALYSRLVS